MQKSLKISDLILESFGVNFTENFGQSFRTAKIVIGKMLRNCQKIWGKVTAYFERFLIIFPSDREKIFQRISEDLNKYLKIVEKNFELS